MIRDRIIRFVRVVMVLLITLPVLAQTSSSPITYPELPSETPAKFQPVTDSFDYIRRVAMIPMRDGVKLHTVILVPKGANDAPILLTRTPYNADELTSHSPRSVEPTEAPSSLPNQTLVAYATATEVIMEVGYIRVVQDARGKY